MNKDASISLFRYINKKRKENNQFFDADWKMKRAVRTPTNAVTANATVGKGPETPKFSRSPLPVAISTLIAAAKPTMADRPSHTSKLPSSLLLCSHRMESDAALLGIAFIRENLFMITVNT